MNTPRIITTLVTALVLASPALAVAAARVELPRGDQLAVDVPAQLVVTVDGEAARAPTPRIPNADVSYTGQMSSSTVTNGRATTQTSFVYTIVPRKVGVLAIPPITVGDDTTPAMQARVAAEPSPPTSSANPSVPPRGAQAPARATREPTRAYVRLDVPRRTLYVGEAVPVTIRAYFRAGTAATLQGAPTVTSEAFTLSQLSDKPAQTEVEVDGVPYLLVTWKAVLSPVKPTEDRVRVELPVEIAYREQREVQRPSARDLLGSDPFAADLDALFDDPFFADPFSGFGNAMFDIGAMRQQTLTLRHDVGRARIADVPDAGKPPGFGGAVGQFELAAESPRGELRVGEPATLTFRVSGTGNFDRVAVAGIAPSAEWKVYPGSTTFEPAKRSAISGTKVITQTIVPARAGDLEIPAVAFSYFDPEAKAYRTVSTAPLTATVAPATDGGAADPGLTSSSVRDASMIANRVERGETHATLVPLVRRDGIWLAPAALVAMTLLLAGLGMARRSDTLAERRTARRIDHAVAAERRRLAAAAAADDRDEFFTAARRALQLRLAAMWGVAPETITAADVTSRLGESGTAIRELFEHADGLTYAHGLATPHALDRWQAIVDHQLASLEGAR